MDFIDRIRELALQIPNQRQHVRTEEGTKNAMVMPFIGALGYNVFDPTEVTPEFVADVGTKKGEKVDYVILKDSKPIMLVECKCCDQDLDLNHASQLYRYFSVTDARFSILTNGVVYRFYTDLEAPNKMDNNPFFEFNMLDFSDQQVEDLKRFTKTTFDVDGLLSSASELKFTREIKRILALQTKEPSEEFVRFFVNQIYVGRMTQNVRERFTDFTRKAFNQFINDQINERLKTALAGGDNETPEPEPLPDTADRQIVTTPDEIEAYYIVKTLLRETVDAKRVTMRDALSYCSILLDDNNRRPICRLYFNTAQKSVGFFGIDKKEEKIKIAAVDDIFQHGDRLKVAVAAYDK